MNIAIVGAGLIGRLCAWQCAEQNITVSLFDQDSCDASQSSAWVAAAMLAPLSESYVAPIEVYQQGLVSLRRWPQLLKQLEQQTQQSIFFQQNGSLIVAHPQDQAYLIQFKQHLERQFQQRGEAQHNNPAFIHLNAEQLAITEPLLTQSFSSCLHLPQEGCLDNRQLLSALESYLLNSKYVHWHTHTHIENVQPHRLRYSGNTSYFDCVVDCRGAGAINQIAQLRGVRGELIWIKAPGIALQHPVRLMHPRYQLYVVPHADDVFVVGATEIESESQQPITVRSSLELLSALYSISSGFSEACIIGAYARLRPAFRDNLPQINHRPGLIQVNGLYRHGYLLAPVVLCDLLQILNTAQHLPAAHNNLLWPQIYTADHFSRASVTHSPHASRGLS